MSGSSNELKKRVGVPMYRDSILKGIEFNYLNDRGGGDARLIQFGNVNWDTTLNGKTLYDYAAREGVKVTPANCSKLILQLQLKGGASCIFHVMSDEDVQRIMQKPYTMIASDGGHDLPHPRSYGTFPKVLGHYVRETNILNLEEAVMKMTSLPAKRMGLKDRGQIRKGFAADITIFDRNKIIDRSTYQQPDIYPEGIEYVIVNGSVALVKGKLTNNFTGEVLRGPAFKPK
jgi:N-acyl-D-aspartate/D-glutamate deacylase